MPKPSELVNTTTPTGSEYMVIEKSGTTYKVPLSRVKEYASTLDIFDRTPQENDPTPVCHDEQTITARWGHSSTCQYGYTNISGPFSLPLNSLQGNMLPITGFYLDDCAFIVPPYDTDDWTYATDVSNHNITLPANKCFMITNGTAALMSGSIDGGGATYQYDGSTYTHGNASASSVATALSNLGVPVIAYNDISLHYLLRFGFQSDDGESLAFRILHDGQGCGGVYMDVSIQVCG